jgi:hypothetical protein
MEYRMKKMGSANGASCHLTKEETVALKERLKEKDGIKGLREALGPLDKLPVEYYSDTNELLYKNHNLKYDDEQQLLPDEQRTEEHPVFEDYPPLNLNIPNWERDHSCRSGRMLLKRKL